MPAAVVFREVLFAACFFAAPCWLQAAPPAHVPGGPAEFPARTGIVQLDGAAYVPIDELAQQLGLTLTWPQPEKRALLATDSLKIELSPNSREISVDGLRVFLGQPTRWYKRMLCVSQIDAEHVLTSFIRAADGKINVPKAVKTIVVDPGHGGSYIGTQNERLKMQEKTYTLDTALRLQTVLAARGYTVVMTRTEDRDLSPDWKVDLHSRAEVAKRAKADLFVSIHYNAAAQNSQQISGLEVFRYTPQFQLPAHRNERRPEDDSPYPADNYTYWNSLLGLSLYKAVVAEVKGGDRGFRHD